jgi:hypothetical protein
MSEINYSKLGNRPHLKSHLEIENAFVKQFGGDFYDPEAGLTEKQVDSIFGNLEARLSPENLNCDGEISREEANNKHQFLTSVWVQLESFSGIQRKCAE